jgi:hypothetical protein
MTDIKNSQEPPILTETSQYALGAVKGNESISILLKNGKPCRCHKVTAILMPNPVAGAAPIRDYEFCSTMCSRARIMLQGDIGTDDKPADPPPTLVYVQTCEPRTEIFYLVQPADDKKKDQAVTPQSTGKPNLRVLE